MRAGRAWSWRRPGERLEARRKLRRVVLQRNVQDVDPPLAPELFLERVRVMLDRPRGIIETLLAPNAVQDDAYVPVAQAVAEKQEVAALQFGCDPHRQERRDVGPGQGVDVPIFGD